MLSCTAIFAINKKSPGEKMLYKITPLSTIFIFFIINISNALPLTSVPKTIYFPLVYDDQIPYSNPITYVIFITRIMNQERKIPKDITRQIINHTILLKGKDFDKNFYFKNEWENFRIPLHYQYILASKHLNLLHNLFKYEPDEKFIFNTCNIYYCLRSKKDYKLFLQLPQEIRKCLIKLPQSAPGDWRNLLNPYKKRNINTNKEIYVLTSEGYRKKKLILPDKKIIYTITWKGSL